MSTSVDVPTTDPALTASVEEVEAALARKVTIGGVEFTLRTPTPMGAFAVFAVRLQDKNPVIVSAAWVQLMRAWLVPECRDQIDDMMEQVLDLDDFALHELPRLVEAVAARPM